MPQGSYKLRRLLIEQKHIVAPGAFFPLMALQIEAAGFGACYVSGAAFSTSLGMLDEGYISREEMTSLVGSITRVSDIPIIVDCDTGLLSGRQISLIRINPESRVNETAAVTQTVKALEKAGAAAIQIEDQDWRFKRCGHLEDKQLIPARKMKLKIRAAVRARDNPDFMIIARTDARAVEGLRGAIERARVYKNAGADAIFPEALESLKEFEIFRTWTDCVPLIANLAEQGKTPSWIRAGTLFALGYSIVLFPATGTRAMHKTHADYLADIEREGRMQEIVKQNRIISRNAVNEFIIKYSKLHNQNPR